MVVVVQLLRCARLCNSMDCNMPGFPVLHYQGGGWHNKCIFGEISSVSGGFQVYSSGKESACNAGDLDLIPAWEDPLEKDVATHSSILAWRIPCTEEPGRLQSMRLQRVGRD